MNTTDGFELGQTVRCLAERQRVFGRYSLLRPIGRGGMSVVWLAQDELLSRELALKFLPESVASDPLSLKALKDETCRALALTHPNIVRVHDFISDGALAAISMEYIEGGTLAALRLQRPGRILAIAELRLLLFQLCDALEYAHHTVKLVHRDLKPANLMLAASGELKVTDFGVAGTLSDATLRVSRMAGATGTPSYMSPQQLMGETPCVADDVYSIGATLYELLTGKAPFFSGDLAAQVRNKTLPSMQVRRSELGIEGERIPAEWEALVAACLAKRAAERPQSVAELARRLKGADAPLLSQAASPAPSESWNRGALEQLALARERQQAEQEKNAQVPKPVSLRMRWLTIGVLLALFAALVAYLGWQKWQSWAREASEAKARGEVAARLARIHGPQQGERWEIPGLGMKFMPVSGASFLCSIWETRLQDFKAFMDETGYRVSGLCSSYRSDKLGQFGDTWISPGFLQEPTHPVVGVNQADAKAFCEWLTCRERAAERLADNQEYRLPSISEWRLAFGSEAKSQGALWPPPKGAGNFADDPEASSESGKARNLADDPLGKNSFVRSMDRGRIIGYVDAYKATAPVGSFTPNRFGLYDLSGNAAELCEEGRYMGGSFSDCNPGVLFGLVEMDIRQRRVDLGFRIICAPSPELRKKP